MFDSQAWFARDTVLGKIKLASDEELKKEFQQWRDRENKLATIEEMLRFQGSYVKELIAATDYPNLDIDGVIGEFLNWVQNKKEDIMAFRDRGHRSLLTGDMATVHHTPWMTAMDDS